MFTHPYLGSQLTRRRQRDLLTEARQQHLVRQFREHAGQPGAHSRAVGRWPALKRTRPDALPS